MYAQVKLTYYKIYIYIILKFKGTCNKLLTTRIKLVHTHASAVNVTSFFFEGLMPSLQLTGHGLKTGSIMRSCMCHSDNPSPTLGGGDLFGRKGL